MQKLRVRLATARALIAVVSFSTASVAPTSLRADSPAPANDAQSAIARAHQEIDADISRKDTASIVKLCTTDFHHLYQDGRIVEMPQYVKDTQKQFKRVDSIASATQVISVTRTPEGAVDTIKQRITAVAPYRVLFVRRHANVTIDYVIDEQWVYDATAGWLLRQSKTTSERQHIKP